MISLDRGVIVWAEIADPRGGNAKDRPCVVLSRRDEIDAAGEFVAVAVTSTLPPDPLPREYVELPWHAAGHPVTGLNRRCAAVCNWIVSVRVTAVVQTGRKLRGRDLYELMQRIDEVAGGFDSA